MRWSIMWKAETMPVECPHCLTKVIPDHDGICPACREDTGDPTGFDPTRARMKIDLQTYLPPICYQFAITPLGSTQHIADRER